jgi:hypothetical protein
LAAIFALSERYGRLANRWGCGWIDSAQWLSDMDPVRCLDCGATRWALTPTSLEHLLAEPCEMCGGEVVLERRRPGTRMKLPFVERRGTHQREHV